MGMDVFLLIFCLAPGSSAGHTRRGLESEEMPYMALLNLLSAF